MSENRTETAIQRIEAALARIADIADAPAPQQNGSTEASPPAVSALVEKHETLQETVNSTLHELDELIAELDR